MKYKEQQIVREYKCKICNKLVLWYRDSIRRHIENNHLLTLEFYEKTYLDKKTVTQKENFISPFKDLCHKKVKEKGGNFFSENIHFEKSDGFLKCEKCLFKVKAKEEKKESTNQLKRHIAKYHFVCVDPYKCCQKEFWTKWNIFIHLVENHRLEKNLFDKFSLGFNIEYLEKLILEETLEVEEIGSKSRSNICWDCETPQTFQSHSDFLLHLKSHIAVKLEEQQENLEKLDCLPIGTHGTDQNNLTLTYMLP